VLSLSLFLFSVILACSLLTKDNWKKLNCKNVNVISPVKQCHRHDRMIHNSLQINGCGFSGIIISTRYQIELQVDSIVSVMRDYFTDKKLITFAYNTTKLCNQLTKIDILADHNIFRLPSALN
jgi:hypothetical protein